MNIVKIKSVAFAAIIISLAGITSCDKKLNLTDPNVVSVDQYFKTSAQIQEGTNAIYSAMKGSALTAREWFFLHDLRSDDIASGGAQLEAPRRQILSGNTDASNPVASSVWNGLFTMIHRANTVIKNSGNGTDNPELTARCVAEAKFLRGWAYNELVTLWGAVPIFTEPVSGSNDFKPRSNVEDVYALVIADLTDASAILPEKSGYPATSQGRVTKAAANAMLGRVYMQRGDYAAAKTALMKINKGGANGYELVGRYLDNFEEETEFSNESIFEVIFFDRGDFGFDWGGTGDGVFNGLTTLRTQEYNAVAWRNVIPSNPYLNNFENTASGATKTDPRLRYSVYRSGDLFNNDTETLTDALQNGESSVINGITLKASWRKYMLMYKENSGFHPGGNNHRLIRFAEILLNLAECEVELGNLPAAVGYLNQVRDRASVNMPNYPTAQYPVNSKANVMKALIHEKWAELGCEEIRNTDILRWRKKGYFTTEPITYFRANRDELLPIPQSEIDNNPALGSGGVNAQNPGY